ncbi:hypothetical protein GCM10008014_58430 [Paenibacillus silvae]|uniref:Butirosin biosynthesis protein H N-terminal domain-containing protein n=1 Tax=Paenibacillus silvae TaxID=1325358 RepID=A0ABQ1ZNN8_9BACL|nr:hypothetical protein [Paenibacillus silvae]GGH72249.1 hypothetical protein GCM10008014_58430 [Paenibacillus silvae]
MSTKMLSILIPPIHGYLCNAYPLSIALQNSNSEAWFLSNYIQVVCAGNFPEGKFFTFYNSYFEWDSIFLGCPFINYQKIHYQLIKKYNGELISFICDAIEKNNYVYLYVDEYYISHKSAFNKYSLPHEMLIFGYNRTESTFNVLGYDANTVFGKYEVSFDELTIAYQMCDKSTKNREYLYLLESNEDFNYQFDTQLVIQTLREYRYSINTSLHFRAINPPNDWWIYGMAAYTHFVKYIRSMMESLEGVIDIRIFHTLWEHKRMMVLRINYIQKRNILINSDDILKQYTYIQDSSLILMRMVMKYNLINDKKTLEKIEKKILEIESLETQALDNLIKRLESRDCPH